MAEALQKPAKASRHCRHYSYQLGEKLGPTCAQGCDLNVPGSIRPCMPESTGPCTLREEYTTAERAAWDE